MDRSCVFTVGNLRPWSVAYSSNESPWHKARASPFYIMDEVEAALDDANLGRLLTIFEDLRETSQLIVINSTKTGV